MYQYLKFAVLFLALLLAGCGGGNGEKLAKSSLDTMKELTDAFEKGDKNSIMAAAKKLQTILKEGKELKVSEGENKRINEKYQAQMQQQAQKMLAAMTKAVSSGKISQADMMEIGSIMQQLK
ncbi:MAG: hypothetical protein QM703_11545 [Gemmatales bacterium]